MTIFFPDVSHFQAGLKLDGAVAVIAKASEGNYWTDLSFVDFRTQAAALGIPFLPYHFLNTGDVPGNVAWCKKLAGDVPIMLDVETARDGGKPTLAETLEFIDRHGRVVLAYIPHWYWQGWGSPDLTGLTTRGVGLISSYYTIYSDSGPGWNPYGGVTPSIWQYTDAHQFNGQAVDFNAFKGTQDQLRALFNGGDDMTPLQAELLWNSAWRLQGILQEQDPIVVPPHTPTMGENWTAHGFSEPNLPLQRLKALGAAAPADHTHTVTATAAGSTGPAVPLDPTP